MKRRTTTLLFLLLVSVILAVPSAMAQQGKKVSLKCDRMPLGNALYMVERQSDYYKLNYNADDMLKYQVTAEVKNEDVPKAVSTLLRGLPFSSVVKGKYIYITKRTAITARGRLIDSDGEPLVGATVKVAGANRGTVTDSEGFYSLPDIMEGELLEYAYLGMKPYKRAASDKLVNIMLETDTYTLDDVMVTGYQNLKRENATGAFQTISSESLDDRYVANLSDHLEGKIAGLVNYDNQLTIRGVGTLKASSSPLVVVDGLPISGTLSDVNPYDVEKITVLKDAAAAAIYGARASNGVIVVVTKKATKEKLTVDFNADVTMRNKLDYDDLGYCNAAEQLELEQYNFNWMVNNEDALYSLEKYYKTRGNVMSPVSRLMMRHYKGEISDDEYDKTIQQWGRNSYRNQWQDLMEHNRLQQQYNLAVRTKGKYLNSSVIVNWKGDNTTMKDQYDNTLSMQYNGQLDVTKWLDMNFGVTLNNNRTKTRPSGYMGRTGMTSFAEYESMYNADGTPATLQAYVWLDEPSLSDPDLGLKDEEFVAVDELRRNAAKSRETYVRSFVHLNAHPLPELKLSAMFQYEDISNRSESLIEGDSYSMRHQYNLFTSGGKHYLPEGGQLDQTSGEGNYYTFRTQATYDKTFAEKHAVSAIAGFEFRQTYSRSERSRLYGYDDQTLTNNTGLMDFASLITLESSDLGKIYSPSYVFLSSDVAGVSENKHRYESYYFTANYTYDKRYSLSGSYRVDKADLFGADPKFRSRPLRQWEQVGTHITRHS